MAGLRVEEIYRSFGGVLALAGVSLQALPGERHAVIGPNGAGKSTLFKVIAGELQPTRGRVYLGGREITGLPQERIARLGLGRTFQRSSLFPELTVWENLALARKAARGWTAHWRRALEPDEAVVRVLAQVGLSERSQEAAGRLSHGEKRQLEIAMALVQEPQILLLDEPLAGLSGAERERIGRLILGLDPGITVLLVEHDLDYALAFAHKVTVLHYGKVVAQGPPEAIRQDPQVQEIYLGSRWETQKADASWGEVVLTCQRLSAGYGAMQVLQGVDLEVRQREVVALLGRNGMGKTTLLATLMGLLPLQSGEVLLHGRAVGHLPPYHRAALGIALVPQGRRMFEGLVVEEELQLATQGTGGRWTVERIYQVFPWLAERRKIPSRALSGGEQQMVALARALLRNPQVILMDEPSEGLSPLMIRRVAEIIHTLKAEGETVLLAEQNVQMALSVADRVYILEHGQIVWTGRAEEVTDQVLAKYLGV